MSVNKVILVGNVGKDPETRYLEGGTAVCSFPLATSETYRNRDGERITTTEWHNVVLWRGLAEVAEKYVKKGSQLYIEGRIRTRSWDDRDGNKRYTTEIVGDNMQMLGRRADEGGFQQEGSGSTQAEAVRDSGTGSSDQRASSETSAGSEPDAPGQQDDFNDVGDAAEGTDDLPF